MKMAVEDMDDNTREIRDMDKEWGTNKVTKLGHLVENHPCDAIVRRCLTHVELQRNKCKYRSYHRLHLPTNATIFKVSQEKL